MRKRRDKFTLPAMVILATVTGPLIAQKVTEHSLIRPYPGTVFGEKRSEQRNFSEYEFRVGTPPRDYTTRAVRGEYRSLRYFLYNAGGTPNRDIS